MAKKITFSGKSILLINMMREILQLLKAEIGQCVFVSYDSCSKRG